MDPVTASRPSGEVKGMEGVLATLGNRKPGKPLVHMGRLFALKDAYRVNLKMCADNQPTKTRSGILP